jgi:hypothetical protein
VRPWHFADVQILQHCSGVITVSESSHLSSFALLGASAESTIGWKLMQSSCTASPSIP